LAESDLVLVNPADMAVPPIVQGFRRNEHRVGSIDEIIGFILRKNESALENMAVLEADLEGLPRDVHELGLPFSPLKNIETDRAIFFEPSIHGLRRQRFKAWAATEALSKL
jgi:hypothetical protein